MCKRLIPLLGVLFVVSAHGATFFVPEDRAVVRGAEAIVVGTALASHTIKTDDGAIETVTTISIEETIKGSVGADPFEVIEPGGVYEGRMTAIPGIPRFQDGERSLLFLVMTPAGWRVRDIALGKFSFATDRAGRKLLVRDEGEVAGWDSKGAPYEERRRSAAEFLEFVRTEARGGMGKENYFLSREPFALDVEGEAAKFIAKPLFTPQSYTFTLARWNVFPSPVTFYSIGTQTGAPGNGTTAITAAFNAWNGDPSSNVNYVYGGQDTSGSHPNPAAQDGQNSIYFERDLSGIGVSPVNCTSNSYTGVLGVTGFPKVSGSHSGPGGITWATTIEQDVQMNKTSGDCSFYFNSGDFNSAVTHEVGHTLSFRHADEAQGDPTQPPTPCNPANEECWVSPDKAIMKAFISPGINAALQTFDQHAIAAIYPAPPPPGIPTGVVAMPASSTTISVQWTAVAGATSYEIYSRAPGGSFTLRGTSASSPFLDGAAPNTAYLYRVRALNSGGSSGDSASDLATTVIFTDDALSAGSTVVKAVHLAQLRTAADAVRAQAGLGGGSYTDMASPGIVVKAVHITQVRTALDAGMSILGLTTGGYTDGSLTGVVVKAVHVQEIRNRVK